MKDTCWNQREFESRLWGLERGGELSYCFTFVMPGKTSNSLTVSATGAASLNVLSRREQRKGKWCGPELAVLGKCWCLDQLKFLQKSAHPMKQLPGQVITMHYSKSPHFKAYAGLTAASL